jgi:hypothetical protein
MNKRGPIITIIAFLLLLGAFSQAGDTAKSFGHAIPPFNQVFEKLFRHDLELMSLDQLRTVWGILKAPEKSAIITFLGPEAHDRITKGLPADKQAFIDEQYQQHKGTPGPDFQPIYPHILAVTDNNLTMDQHRQTLKFLTPEEIASQSFYMGEEGRRVLFTELTPDRTEAILSVTEDWAFLETGKRRYSQIRAYTSIFFKQERLDGKLQGVEKILLKFREKPLSIYMKWLDGPWKGRELLYNERVIGTGKVRVRESGVLGIMAVTLPVDSEIAMRGSNHMCTEVGLKYLVQLIEEQYRKALPKGHIKRVNHGIVALDGGKVFKMESILPKNKSLGYYCYRMIHYIDYLRSIEIKAEVFNWDDQLYESYYYTQIKLNPPLTDKDFDPDNPDYNL